MKGIGKSQHKAVAPIIATLLMVAIAVVGGILIFVFTQGFFADEQVVGPVVDELVLFGYDARDQGIMNMHDGEGNGGAANDDENPDNKLDDGDLVLIYARNVGDSTLSIASVDIFDQKHFLDVGAGTANDCYSVNRGPGLGTIAVGEFGIRTNEAQVYNCTGASLIEPNDEVTIILVYEEDGAGEVKMGKKLPIKVHTENGQTFLLNAINGAKRGTGNDGNNQ